MQKRLDEHQMELTECRKELADEKATNTAALTGDQEAQEVSTNIFAGLQEDDGSDNENARVADKVEKKLFRIKQSLKETREILLQKLQHFSAKSMLQFGEDAEEGRVDEEADEGFEAREESRAHQHRHRRIIRHHHHRHLRKHRGEEVKAVEQKNFLQESDRIAKQMQEVNTPF